MDIVIWILQGLMGLVFIAAGAAKIAQPKAKLMEAGDRMAWVEDFSQGQIRIIGALELLGGLGLILPWLTGILPILTPLAAAGLALTMIGAAFVHYRRKESQGIVINMVLMVLVLAVLFGRLVLVPYVA